jgi:hypothetical protein
MAIDSKKILGDTPAEYHERTGTNAFDYMAEGVHAHSEYVGNILDTFTHRVPDNAEVVVNYRVSGGKYYYASGTALIPKGPTGKNKPKSDGQVK